MLHIDIFTKFKSGSGASPRCPRYLMPLLRADAYSVVLRLGNNRRQTLQRIGN